MSLLAPAALWWLLSVPVLIWLWRLTASRRRLPISSLVPFERLLERAPRRRSHLTVNLLFWLQLAGLIGLALALARPVSHGRPSKTVLAVFDTSASMGARGRGPEAFEQARQALLARAARKAPTEQWILMTTAPPAAATPQPTSDGAALRQAIAAQRPVHLGGRLSTAVRLGLAVLGRAPDETLIVTDEPPPQPLPRGVRWVRVGRPRPNAAITGVDASGAFCTAADARAMVTLQQFAGAGASYRLTASQQGQRLFEQEVALRPGQRQAVSVPLPAGTQGRLEIALSGAPDALAADNRVWVDLREAARMPVVIRSARPRLTDTVSGWLSACETLTWTAAQGPAAGAHVLITDRTPEATGAAAVMQFVPPPDPSPVLSHWVVTAEHPVSAYLAPVELVAAAVPSAAEDVPAGVPVISALRGGRSIPVVAAAQEPGRRRLLMTFDPVGTGDATPVLLVFFNGLRWLMGETALATTTEPLAVGGWGPGPVSVHRPDGAEETATPVGGWVRYDQAVVAGVYRLRQGAAEVTAIVNFFDPLESDTMTPASTWHAVEPAEQPPPAAAPPAHPLTPLLLTALLILLVAEWLAYAMRGRAVHG